MLFLSRIPTLVFRHGFAPVFLLQYLRPDLYVGKKKWPIFLWLKKSFCILNSNPSDWPRAYSYGYTVAHVRHHTSFLWFPFTLPKMTSSCCIGSKTLSINHLIANTTHFGSQIKVLLQKNMNLSYKKDIRFH